MLNTEDSRSAPAEEGCGTDKNCDVQVLLTNNATKACTRPDCVRVPSNRWYGNAVFPVVFGDPTLAHLYGFMNIQTLENTVQTQIKSTGHKTGATTIGYNGFWLFSNFASYGTCTEYISHAKFCVENATNR